MACFYPLIGYRSRFENANGKRPIVFDLRQAIDDKKIELPCGQCVGCRLERSRQWAIRCMHESQMFKNNSFVTLTYKNEELPKNGSLDLSDLQKFLKSLRRSVEYELESNKNDKLLYYTERGSGIRYFACGEYGEKFKRPHYHLCIFNIDFADKEILRSKNGMNYYISENLNGIWKKGHVLISDVTFESAAYVARYIMKKVTGSKSVDHYETDDVDKETGEVIQRKKEFCTMSRRPGLGKEWLDNFKFDVYPDDFIVLRGKKIKVPKYYDNKYENMYPHDFEIVKMKREEDANEKKLSNSYLKLRVKERNLKKRLSNLIRGFEDEE